MVSTQAITSKSQPFDSLFFNRKNKVFLKASFTISLSMICSFLTKNTFPISTIFEISILHPIQPARRAVSASGGLFYDNLRYKKLLRYNQKIINSPAFCISQKEKIRIIFRVYSFYHCRISTVCNSF